jgi:CBS domain containing-hemolysin-like protein
MIRRVFTFTDLTARQIMVPRRDMVCLPVTMSLDDALTFALNSAYTRFPVYDKGLDDIVGVVHVKDIMRALRGLAPADGLRSIMRPPLLVPETIGADELITHFRRHRTHMAILVDEFGGTAGLVTTQDILEEIVGDVADEFDRDEVSWEEGDDGSILLSGKLPLALINEQLGLNLSHENMVTVGGLVFSLLGRRPQVGDSVWVAGVRLSVEAMDGLRVARVRLTRVPQDNG